MRESQKQSVVDALRLYLDRTQTILNIIAHKAELSRTERAQSDLLLLELGTSIDMERGRLHSTLYQANEYEERHLKPDLERLRKATRACWGEYSRQWEDYLRDAIGEMTYSILDLTAV